MRRGHRTLLPRSDVVTPALFGSIIMASMRPALPTGTVTFLFTDVEGSTKLLHELGSKGYAAALAEHRRIVREAFSRHGGVEVDTQGDAFFFAFPDAAGALAAAGRAQQALAGGPIRVRMGLHSGEPLLTAEGYVGLDVHRGARVMSAGHGGQVLVSETAHALLDGEAGLTNLGLHRLKDLTEPQRLWQLGDGEFPPLKTLYQTNLPVQPTPLVGREAELAEVLALLRKSRLITLTGAGGSGKTRLALQAAAELVDDYKDGVWWVSLAALRDPELVEPTIAQVVGAKDSLAEHLRSKQMLLLLDNFEQLLDAAPRVAELLAEAPGLRVLATSRERLGLAAEHEYAVPTMVPVEAVALFAARAHQLRPDFEPDETVHELCRRLDGLPLAIELAAARIKVLRPEQILERLASSLDLLTAGARDAPERHQTLRATIEWSHDLLDNAEQQLFARLAVFAGSFDLEAAEAVCDADLDTLAALVDKSLLRRTHEGRFFLLDTIRAFSLERLEQRGEHESLRRRHAEHFQALVERGFEHRSSGLAARIQALDVEHDNLRAALEWSREVGDAEVNLTLANTLWTLWGTRGQYTEGLNWLKQGLESTEGPTRLRAQALNWASAAAMFAGDGEEAQALAEEGLSLWRALGDEVGIAHAQMMLGGAFMAKGDYVRARSSYEESGRLCRTLGRATGLASTVHNLGLIDLEEGDYERAKQRLEEAMTTLGEEDSNSICALGLVALLQRRSDEAHRLLSEGLRRSSALGHSICVIECLIGLADVAAISGDSQRAARLLGSADTLADDLAAPLPPVLLKIQRHAAAAARSETEARAEGRRWSTEAAVDFALSNIDSN